MRKIVFISDNFPPKVGGVATYSYQLPLNFKKYHPEDKVVVLAFNNEQFSGDSDMIIRLPKSKSLFIHCLTIARALWKQRDGDVFQATTLFPTGFITMLFSRLLRKPYFQTVYGTEVITSRISPVIKFLKKWTLLQADKILAFSQSTRLLMTTRYGIPEERSVVIYPGIDLPVIEPIDVRQKHGLSTDDFVVLFVGRLVQRKGVDDLIEAIRLLPHQNIKALIVGGGQRLEELEQSVKDMGLEQRIIFVGQIPLSQVGSYYKAADCFTMPSYFEPTAEDIEGLGIVYLEAQSLGLPVIGTASGGIPEAIADGRSGYVIPERDVTRLAGCIEILATDRALYEKMSENARIFVNESFSWRQTVESHEKIYSNE